MIAADIVFEVGAFPKKGTKNRASTSRLITGGGALNAASAIASLGGEASLCGAIGDDEFGQFLRQKMAECGISDLMVTTIQGLATSRSANVITSDGDRTIVNHRDTKLVPDAATVTEDFPFDAALVDTRFPLAAAQIVQAARRAGKPAIIDAEAPVADAQVALSAASHIVFSEQGLEDYCGSASPEALDRVAIDLGTWCAVTRGASSVLCHDSKKMHEVPVFPVLPLNTLGAGDVWHGAFALALAQGKSELKAARWANAAAALKVNRPVHEEQLPTFQDVATFLNDTESA